MLEVLQISKITEEDFTQIIESIGGRRYSADDSREEDLNCDYLLDDAVIELKIIEEEPIEKTVKQERLAKLFKKDVKSVLLNPYDLDDQKKTKYFQILESSIKRDVKKASKQLQKSQKKVNASVRVAIVFNYGLSMTSIGEFEEMCVRRAKNDTSGIDILIVGGVYYYSDGYDHITIFPFDSHVINEGYEGSVVCKLKDAWGVFTDHYMTQQITNLELSREKGPIIDLWFEQDGVRYVKPPIQWGKTSEFYEKGRPRIDSTGMHECPPVATFLPRFNEVAYDYAKQHMDIPFILKDGFQDYCQWIEQERQNSSNIFQPIVLLDVDVINLKQLDTPFAFEEICFGMTGGFRRKMARLHNRVKEFDDNIPEKRIVIFGVTEIGIDKANDYAVISHVRRKNRDWILEKEFVYGERMKFEYASVLACSYCLSVDAEAVYYMKDETWKWK